MEIIYPAYSANRVEILTRKTPKAIVNHLVGNTIVMNWSMNNISGSQIIDYPDKLK